MLTAALMHVSATHNSIVKLIVTLPKKGHESGTCWKVRVKICFFLLWLWPPWTKKEKRERERSANWLANSLQTNGQLAVPACRPPPLGCLATPTVLLGCLMTLVAAVAQGLLMKPPDRLLSFKTWKLTDHWTGTSGYPKTSYVRQIQPPTWAAVVTHLHTSAHKAHLNLLLTVLPLTLGLSTSTNFTSFNLNFTSELQINILSTVLICEVSV